MSKKGKFTKELNLIKGKNVLNFRYNNEQKKHIKWYLDSFSDLKNHWLAKEVAILKHLNLLPNSIKDAVFFEPKKKVSHRELTEIIETIFPSKKQTRTLQFFRKKSLEEELSKELNKRGYVTKLEVLEKIINASKLTRKENQKQALPFKDLPTQESSRNNLQIAYDHKLISKATYLYPNKEITKAELFSIVYKLPHIQKEVAVFLKDS